MMSVDVLNRCRCCKALCFWALEAAGVVSFVVLL